MPKYSVRRYATYVDEYEVEATSEEEAIALADDYQYYREVPKPGELEKLAGKVAQVTDHEHVSDDETCVNELDAAGNWIDA